jgi:predicted nucleotide-binding protein
MATAKPFLFVSYAREDYATVSRFVSTLRSLGVDTWMDVDALKPGELWEQSIHSALTKADGLLIFVSRNSMGSQWVKFEVQAIFEREEMRVIPVILEEVADLPPALRKRQWLMLTDASAEAIDRAARTLAEQFRSAAPVEERPVTPRLEAVTSWVLDKARGLAAPGVEPSVAAGAESLSVPGPAGAKASQQPPDSIFVVHGHDLGFRDGVVNYVRGLQIKPVILSRIGGAQQSLLQKFMNYALDARFAVVLLSADDLGASRKQYETPGVGEKCLQFRARQNVIFELGFFYGRLGWENVFVVYKPPPIFPNFEHPSDLLGTVWDELDAANEWRGSLSQRLAAAGFSLPASAS